MIWNYRLLGVIDKMYGTKKGWTLWLLCWNFELERIELVTSPRDLGIVDIRNCLFEPSTGTCQSSNKVPSSNLFGERFWKKHQVWSPTRLQTCRGKWNYWNRIFGCQSLQWPRHCLADRGRRRMRHWVGVSKTWSPSWRVFGLNLKSQKKTVKLAHTPKFCRTFRKFWCSWKSASGARSLRSDFGRSASRRNDFIKMVLVVRNLSFSKFPLVLDEKLS